MLSTEHFQAEHLVTTYEVFALCKMGTLKGEGKMGCLAPAAMSTECGRSASLLQDYVHDLIQKRAMLTTGLIVHRFDISSFLIKL